MRLCSEKSRRWKRILRVDDVEVGDFKTIIGRVIIPQVIGSCGVYETVTTSLMGLKSSWKTALIQGEIDWKLNEAALFAVSKAPKYSGSGTNQAIVSETADKFRGYER